MNDHCLSTMRSWVVTVGTDVMLDVDVVLRGTDEVSVKERKLFGLNVPDKQDVELVTLLPGAAGVVQFPESVSLMKL